MDFDFTKQPGRELLKRGLSGTGEALVSIITPYYNAGKVFEQTFNSVMNQTFPWFEWIIVDDGSTDKESVRKLETIVLKDKRIRLFRQNNGGQAAARNVAIQHSTTEIIIPLDADDLIVPSFVEELYFALKMNPDAAWAYTDSVGFGDRNYLWKQSFSATRMKEENILVCTAAIRKQWLNCVNGYTVSKQIYDEDWHLWLRLLEKGAWPVHISGYSFWYRRSASGAQQTVQSDRSLRKQSRDRIREAAEKVDTSVAAKEYPGSGVTGRYASPKVSTWDRKVFAQHDKTHVLMLLPWMEMGGADLFNLDICARLDKSRFEVGIITTQYGENSWQQRFAEHVTDIFNLPEFLDIENWAEFISYYIKSREVDVLFLSNSYYGYYLIPWLRKEFPELAIIDYVHMEEWYWRNGGYARTSGVMGEILEKTYVCNERTRQVLIRDFHRAPESVETLYIGVDAEKYDASKVEAGAAKKELGIAAERPMILFPCRMHPQKRPFLMLEIARRLPELAFTVVGDGPELDALRDAVKRAGLENTVFFAGRQSDMRPWYRDAALTLICSLKEGLALTAYESLSMGVPVVSSDVGGQAELIDESVGRIVPLLQNEAEDLESRAFSADEIAQYVEVIKELLSDQEAYAEMSRDCRKRIEEGFSSQIMIQKLQAILEENVANEDLRKRRCDTSKALNRLRHYVDDAFGTYERLEAKQQEAEEVWASREWFRKLYEQQRDQNAALKELPPTAVDIDDSEAKRRLDEIYQMRSWKFIQRYQHFMDHTWIGKLLSGIRNILFRRHK